MLSRLLQELTYDTSIASSTEEKSRQLLGMYIRKILSERILSKVQNGSLVDLMVVSEPMNEKTRLEAGNKA